MSTDRLELSNQLYKSKMNTKGCIATTSNNVLFSCFSQGCDTDNYIIKVMRSNDNGITWTDTNFPIVAQVDHSTPYIVIDSSNIIHVVFSAAASIGGSLRIFYSSSNTGGASWTTPISLQPLTGYDQVDPKMVFDKKNNVLSVVWVGTDSSNGNTQIKYCHSLDNGTTWSYFKNVATIAAYAQSAPKITIDSAGAIYIFWQGCDTTSTTKLQVKFTKSIDYGSSWLTWKNIAQDLNYDQTNVDVAIDSANGAIYATWQQADATHTAQQIKINKSVNGGAVWSSPVLVTDITDAYNQELPHIVIDSSSVIHLFWRAYNNTSVNRRIKYTKTTDLATFIPSSYVTAPTDDVANFAMFKLSNYLVITFESFLASYLKKFGFRKYLFQDGNDIKYSVKTTGTQTTVVLPVSSDGITYDVGSIIQKNSVSISDVERAIASSLYTPNYTTGDVVFTTARTGAIKFYYNGIDASSNIIPNQTQTVNPQADGKTYKLACAVQSGSLIAVEAVPQAVAASTYTVDYLNGIITFNNAKVNSIQVQYIPINRTWTTIGQTPINGTMFSQYGHDELTWLTYKEFNKLTSTQPYVLFSDQGMEYARPEVVIQGDALSKYRYQVTMDGEVNPLIKWTDYMVGNKSDSVVVDSNGFADSEPKNIYVDLEQYDDGIEITRRGTVILNNNAPTIFAQINGMRLDLTVSDSDGDKICYNIYANGKKIYPLGTEYTSLLSSPSNLSYIFQTTQLNIDQNNVVIINAKDQYDKKSMVRLDFIGEYVGLIFVDSDGNRYSTDKGTPLQILDMGTIQAGSESNIFPVYLKNSNGFDVQNVSIWGDGIITNGTVKFSKTLSPFVEESMLEYHDILLNEDEILFYIKVESNESIMPGGGDFRVLAKAEVANLANQTQMPAPDPNATVIFNVVDKNGKAIQDATISFNDGCIEKTDVLGNATYKNIPLDGNMNYTIINNGYGTETGTVNVSVNGSTQTVNVVLTSLQTQNVKFTIANGSTMIPNAKIVIKGQTISIGSTTITYNDMNVTTVYDGTANIQLVAGTYQYTVDVDGYVEVNSTFTVTTSAIEVKPTMTPAYAVTFMIANATNPIEYANVNINGKDITADYNGSAITYLANGTYNYTITAVGYTTQTGSITVASTAATKNITLVSI
jgi:hypothetical protein